MGYFDRLSKIKIAAVNRFTADSTVYVKISKIDNILQT